MLSSQLHATTEILPVAGLDRLAEHLPMAWIEQALSATGTASIRRRRLPAEQVVWLVIALALYRHQSMPEVLATLDLALPSATEQPVSKSAVTQARQRLGQCGRRPPSRTAQAPRHAGGHRRRTPGSVQRPCP